MATWRQRRIKKIEQAMTDLLVDLKHQHPRCENCGAYHSVDLQAQSVIDELTRMRLFVRNWAKETWILEGE